MLTLTNGHTSNPELHISMHTQHQGHGFIYSGSSQSATSCSTSEKLRIQPRSPPFCVVSHRWHGSHRQASGSFRCRSAIRTSTVEYMEVWRWSNPRRSEAETDEDDYTRHMQAKPILVSCMYTYIMQAQQLLTLKNVQKKFECHCQSSLTFPISPNSSTTAC
jgi:hypothetical protein